MNKESAIQKTREVLRLKHYALNTEETYCGWLSRFIDFVRNLPSEDAAALTSEQKIERFLTGLAKRGSSASAHNQAFNALLFFYTHVQKKELGKIQSLRANRPEFIRVAPSKEDVALILRDVRDLHGYPTRFLVRLLYGCGLRVSEPLNLRIKDVALRESKLMIRGAKGGKDRVVSLPCCFATEMAAQMRAARVVWEQDAKNRIPVPLPGLLAKKYPQAQFAWNWAWLFPAHNTCLHPRTGETVRYRVLESNVQRAVKAVARKHELQVTPHHLRHAYATHALRQGANIRDLQNALGHSQLETTMRYITPEALRVQSPIELLEAGTV